MNQIIQLNDAVINLRFVRKIVIENQTITFHMGCDCEKPVKVESRLSDYEMSAINNVLHVLYEYKKEEDCGRSESA